MTTEAGTLPAEGVRAMFDRIAPVYDAMNRVMTAGLDGRWRRETASAVVRPGDRVLDSCCGTGDLAVACARAGGTVTGLDFSERMLERARRKSGEIDWVQGDALALPFEDDSFDAALFVGALHHVPDPLKALQEAFRVVKPGGRLFAAEPCSLRVGGAGVAPVPGHQHEFRFSLSFLTGRIEAAGFAVDDVTGKRTALRFARPVLRRPSLGAFRRADRLDRTLAAVPGYTRLAELALVRATRRQA
jgi:SAM-dependent methyltransferase